MATPASRRVVVMALACNLAIAAAKFVAASWTGSSAMLSEAVHSLIDTSNQALLLFGLARAARPPDAAHPFGHSREIYFWSFVVAILLFGLGAGVALYEGAHKLADPRPLAFVEVAFGVLALAFVLEAISTWTALSAFRAAHPARPMLAALRASKNPAVYTVLLEDLAALAGLALAFAGTALSWGLGWHAADGVASIGIGLVLALVAAFMAVETKGLLIGEAADTSIVAGIGRVIRDAPAGQGAIQRVGDVATMHLGPDDVLATVRLDFENSVPAGRVEAILADLEHAVRAHYPSVRRLHLTAGELSQSAHTEPVELTPAAAAKPERRGNYPPPKPHKKAKKRRR